MALSVGTIKYKSGSNWVDILHPVDSLYFSTSSTSPASLFGGTWTQITNAAIRGATSTGYIGSDTHTLTITEMPSHTHKETFPYYGLNSGSYTGHTTYWGQYGTTGGHPNTSATGDSAAHSIVQRSYNCYVWYRAS